MTKLSTSQAASVGAQGLLAKLGDRKAIHRHYARLSAMAGEKRGRKRRPTYEEIVGTRRGARLRDRLNREVMPQTTHAERPRS